MTPNPEITLVGLFLIRDGADYLIEAVYGHYVLLRRVVGGKRALAPMSELVGLGLFPDFETVSAELMRQREKREAAKAYETHRIETALLEEVRLRGDQHYSWMSLIRAVRGRTEAKNEILKLLVSDRRVAFYEQTGSWRLLGAEAERAA